MKIPFEVKDIENPKELFGRDDLLQRLMVDASLKENVNIIGVRRFGKTCVLKSAFTLLRSKKDCTVYPLYVDFKTEDIQGTKNVYAYLIGVLASSLYKDGIFVEREIFGSVEIQPCDEWIDVYEKLLDHSCPKIQSTYQRLVKLFSELMDKTILLIIDEYEYLFKYALDSPTGFMKLRTLSSSVNKDGLRHFCFWLTGCTPWDEHISSVPGSGEANTVSAFEYVTPLDESSFIKMWEYECSFVDDNDTRQFLLDNKLFAYEKSGGVPFYGKNIIGTYMMKNRSLPDYSVCNGVFKELSTKACTIGDYKILKELASAPRKLQISNYAKNLYSKGLVSIKNKNIYYIPIQFLVEFIQAEMNDMNEKQPTIPQTYEIVKSITQKIELINKQRVNYKKQPVFKAVIDSSTQEEDLRTPCYTIDQLSDFTQALYNIYFERSKDGRGQELHYPFFLKHKFAKCVDIARHSIGKGHEMDNFITKDGQYSRADLYVEIMGSADELSSSQEYFKFQVEMLKRFKAVLDEMFSFIKKHKA